MKNIRDNMARYLIVYSRLKASFNNNPAAITARRSRSSLMKGFRLFFIT
jgi:hypothetical protein